MQPEISHRCTSCGASLRDRDALFCHECGKALSKDAQNAEQPGPADSPSVDLGPSIQAKESQAAEQRTAEAPIDAPFEASAAEPVTMPSAGAEVQPQSKGSDVQLEPRTPSVSADKHITKAKDSPTPEKSAAAQPASRLGDKTRERLHRASAVARGVIEDEVKRVEKIRHVSTTIVEEASYDPSLRFVLVALGLFIVFVVLLVLSKVMG
jgi:hypothetical protein